VATHAVKRIDEMEAVYRGAFKKARAELGITSFGVQVIDLPPNADRYPEHDHAEDGQEELYVTLSGGGEIEIEGERFPIGQETLVRVGSGTKRKLYSGADGIRVLVVGGVPGSPYEVRESTELGQPDPMAT
jgi:mannose-6-phosphate isomerase-like protein (cupin superfamily)